jgi:hypothetical protein
VNNATATTDIILESRGTPLTTDRSKLLSDFSTMSTLTFTSLQAFKDHVSNRQSALASQVALNGNGSSSTTVRRNLAAALNTTTAPLLSVPISQKQVLQ